MVWRIPGKKMARLCVSHVEPSMTFVALDGAFAQHLLPHPISSKASRFLEIAR
jgi:hypothetical protein